VNFISKRRPKKGEYQHTIDSDLAHRRFHFATDQELARAMRRGMVTFRAVGEETFTTTIRAGRGCPMFLSGIQAAINRLVHDSVARFAADQAEPDWVS